MGFFGDIERFLAELYAYRWPIVVAGLVVLAAIAAWGVRKGWHLAVWRRRRAVAIVGTPLLILAIVGGWYTVSPLFERSQLEEANPLVSLKGMPVRLTRRSQSASEPDGHARKHPDDGRATPKRQTVG